ncbi:MAG TPA: hypothetical protein VLE70_14710 [Anaerolineae bacterium]|jgi:hypothetical protein|nr:hypothetical protein [Anaerolineae bacterium]
MSIVDRPPIYIAFLLRCWLEESSWRYSLEEVGTGKRHAFATLDEFFSYMLTRSILPQNGTDTPDEKTDELGLESEAKKQLR